MQRDDGRSILVAIDPAKRPEDPLALGVRLARLTSAPLEVATIFPKALLQPEDVLLRDVRDAAEADLFRVIEDAGDVPIAGTHVVGASSPASGLQRLSERDHVGLVVIGSTTRGAVRRTLPGSIADRLLSGAAASVAVAPNGFADEPPPRLTTVGVAYDGSDESRVALDAA